MPPKSNKKLLVGYAGFAARLTMVLLIAVYGGYWIDKKTTINFPLFTCLLPFLVIIVMIVKVIKDTSQNK
jgi:hypothetical protein